MFPPCSTYTKIKSSIVENGKSLLHPFFPLQLSFAKNVFVSKVAMINKTIKKLRIFSPPLSVNYCILKKDT